MYGDAWALAGRQTRSMLHRDTAVRSTDSRTPCAVCTPVEEDFHRLQEGAYGPRSHRTREACAYGSQTLFGAAPCALQFTALRLTSCCPLRTCVL